MSKKKEAAMVSWNPVGKLLSGVTNLFSLIKRTLGEMGIGIEIVAWLVSDEGQPIFVEQFLKPLGQVFLNTQRVRVVNNTALMVNLDAAPMVPFAGATVHAKPAEPGGWVKIEKRADGLYMDSRKVILYLSESQKDGKVIRGHELREELTGKPVLHPNILDALADNPQMFPEDWKKDKSGNTRYVFFWAVIYGVSLGGLCVRYVFFDGGAWVRGYVFLGSGWSANRPAALAS